MESMGLMPGVEVSVLLNSGLGPLLVAVENSRFMLGRGMAEGILSISANSAKKKAEPSHIRRTSTCEGGFSDGSSASGSRTVVQKDGKVVITGKMDENSLFTFEEPQGSYTVIFDAGKGHKVKIKGKDIY